MKVEPAAKNGGANPWRFFLLQWGKARWAASMAWACSYYRYVWNSADDFAVRGVPLSVWSGLRDPLTVD